MITSTLCFSMRSTVIPAASDSTQSSNSIVKLEEKHAIKETKDDHNYRICTLHNLLEVPSNHQSLSFQSVDSNTCGRCRGTVSHSNWCTLIISTMNETDTNYISSCSSCHLQMSWTGNLKHILEFSIEKKVGLTVVTRNKTRNIKCFIIA